MLEAIVQAFQKKYPLHYMEFVKANQISNIELTDKKFGRSQTSSMRWGASFPVAYKEDGSEVSLLTIIEKVFPNFLKDNDIYLEFLRRHPDFRVSQQV